MLLKAKTNIRYGSAAHEFIASGMAADIRDEALAGELLKSGVAELVRAAEEPKADTPGIVAKIAAALKDFGVAESVTGPLALDIYGIAHGALSDVSVTPPPGNADMPDVPEPAPDTPAADIPDISQAAGKPAAKKK